ncbi:MAG: transcription-repair coupling factor [Dehalococcoidales bacterium]|nr:transcription-repair coupling factor [Dehalococcoidales bacterium]
MEKTNLIQLLNLTKEIPSFGKLVNELRQSKGTVNANVIEAARPYLIAALYQTLQRPAVVITAHAETSRRLYEQMTAWLGSEQVRLLPEPDALPYERLISDSPTELERLRVLSALANAGKDKTIPLIIAPSAAFTRKTAAYDNFAKAFHTVREGDALDPVISMQRWQTLGYNVESTVEIPGTMIRRGGIIDIFPPTSELPVRLEFFGNNVESIRFYDPVNQRSQKKADSITIGPATELLPPFSENDAKLEDILRGTDFSNCNEESREHFIKELNELYQGKKSVSSEFYSPLFNHDSLLSYLPENTSLVFDEPLSIRRTIEDFDNKALEIRTSRQEQGELPLNYPTPYFNWEELSPALEKTPRLTLSTLGITDESVHRLDFAPEPNYAGQMPVFLSKIKQMLADKQRLIIVTHQAERLSELLEEEDIIAPVLTEIKQTPQKGSLTLMQGLLGNGWSIHNTHLFTDTEIFGFTKQQRLQKKRLVARHKLFADIQPGDYVVHIEHGIGKFQGFTTLTNNGLDREFMVLQYAAGDKLYVPTDQVDRVGRYVGSGEQAPTLSRLGTQEWTNTRQRVKEAVEKVAEDLLDLYASREVVPGFAYSRDTIWQKELEAAFPYIETPDQITAQKEIKEDMEKTKPMDRLVCGDVGYGKTEVALRAAFKAVMDGKQVAVLVPTTVLAQQHYVTFTERMKAFPIKVEVLSRFRTPKEQDGIVAGLKSGTVDICIGTHRLIQKDIQFKNLGLLIIDEEQRFGVNHKEYLKKMRQEVDVLTLSATPIPRTLHMALVGVRDMSTMETPPEDRLPIKTYVAEYDERLVREAVIRELERDGQVFFVHNRVQSIEIVADILRNLVPEARVSVAHGQMPEGELERVTLEFMDGRSDVLVCSTIIESGLDMPNVNTLIINQADRFGLTQLYQLRGRVGRGATLAYAYFLFDKGKHLTPVAEKRLQTIYEATELGAGFSIAMKDLEIRGAGTLLGLRQSGQISAVGFNLYSQMLAVAVEKLKAQKEGTPKTAQAPSQLPPPTIDLPLSALIPEDYVGDLVERLELYQRMADITDEKQIQNLVQELNDRFGVLPKEVENLLYILKIKVMAKDTGIESISTLDNEIILQLFAGAQFDKKKLANFLRDGIKIGTGQLRMNLSQPGRGWQRVLEEILGRMK